MANTSFQEAYSTNLSPHGKDLPIYNPLKPRELSYTVGDIAYFTENGKYNWVANAFDTQVGLILCAV